MAENEKTKDIQYFHEWEGYSIVCLDQNGSKAELQGDLSAMKMQTIKFQIFICDN